MVQRLKILAKKEDSEFKPQHHRAKANLNYLSKYNCQGTVSGNELISIICFSLFLIT